MRRRVLIVMPVLVIAGAAVAAGAGMVGGDPAGGPAGVALTGPPATATVQKRTLTRTERVGGDLGYGDTAEVQAPPGSRGMVTWLPDDGDVLRRGDTVYRLDQKRVPLLYGTIPLYRTLAAGVEGTDVKQFERNLAALGYTGFTIDADYTSSTAAAVREWQDDLGRAETGRVRVGDAIVATGARRIAELTTATGAGAAGVLLTWTGTTRVVTIALATEHADLVKPGTTATVVLPDDSTVTAKVTGIGTPASTLPVRLAVADQRRLGDYQAAEVDVDLTSDSREDVLAVPVSALVVRPAGGYAVTTGNTHLPVRTGMFAGGYVEVSGTGVVEGLAVGVPG